MSLWAEGSDEVMLSSMAQHQPVLAAPRRNMRAQDGRKQMCEQRFTFYLQKLLSVSHQH